MNELTQEDWQRIDTFIVRDELINAIQLHRQLAQTSLMEAKGQIYAREDAILKIYPRLISTLDDQIDECIRRLDTIQEKVSIIEGSWDGDSRGWFIKIAAITDQPSNHHPRFTEYGLCIVRGIEDQVDRAMKIGNKIAEHAKVGFYLTDDNPDFSTFDYEKGYSWFFMGSMTCLSKIVLIFLSTYVQFFRWDERLVYTCLPEIRLKFR